MDVDTGAITSLATVRLQAKSRLLATACCPDKDLVALVSRVGSSDRLSLWKMQGSRKWEVDMLKGDNTSDEVTALNWSPDGQFIVVAHSPPAISLHSLQNGREEHTLSIKPPSGPTPSPLRITGVWWFKREKKTDKAEMPDMFKRGNVVPGSALSVIRTQPLLDPLQDDTLTLNATDLFAFQGTQSRPSSKASSLPEVISSWPSLPSDPLVASIKPSPRESDNRPGEELDEKDLTNVDSLLVAIDNLGQIHCFLDGTYPLGAISLGSRCEARTLMKKNEGSTLLVHAEFRFPEDPSVAPGTGTGTGLTNLAPLAIELPLLYAKSTRHIAENCSAARELAWYTLRVVKEMKLTWFGGDGHDGARELNMSYVRGLQERQARFGEEEDAVFDLTVLLATGKSSPALSDFNQTGELTSERGLQKWDSTVIDALLRLRDYSEKRVAPACQRLHLLLEEVRGWSLLPQLYGKYEFSTEEVDACLELTARAIVLAAWLAAAARREMFRFSEFMLFLRHETVRLSAAETAPIARHDILEVNEYLMSGLVVSSIDQWFIGPVPQFTPDCIAPGPYTTDLRSTLDHARAFASDPSKLTWPPITRKRDLSHLDRNLDALMHALSEKCRNVFDRAAKAVGRSASLDPTWTAVGQKQQGVQIPRAASMQMVRRRAVCEEKTGTVIEHLAIRLQEGEHGFSRSREVVCIIRHEGDSRTVGVGIILCKVGSEDRSEEEDFHIFSMEFFDEERLVIVYQKEGAEGCMIGLVDYSGIEYCAVDVIGDWEESIVAEAIAKVTAQEWQAAAIEKRRGLVCAEAGISMLSVNGRDGRRVACVLDKEGIQLEMLDIEGEI